MSENNEQTKAVSVIKAGSGEQLYDIAITRGLTCRDLLEQLGLEGRLSIYGDASPFNPDDDLFDLVERGAKLLFATYSPVA